MTIDLVSLTASGDCAVCHEEIGRPPYTVLHSDEGLACRHVFHAGCGDGLAGAGSCPGCGTPYTEKSTWDGDVG